MRSAEIGVESAAARFRVGSGAVAVFA